MMRIFSECGKKEKIHENILSIFLYGSYKHESRYVKFETRYLTYLIKNFKHLKYFSLII